MKMLSIDVVGAVNTVLLLYIVYDLQNVKKSQRNLEIRVAQLEVKTKDMEDTINRLIDASTKKTT